MKNKFISIILVLSFVFGISGQAVSASKGFVKFANEKGCKGTSRHFNKWLPSTDWIKDK